MSTLILAASGAPAVILTYGVPGPSGSIAGVPAGTGFVHITAGTMDGTARAVNLASNGVGGDVTGVLAYGNGGTGLSTLGSGHQVLQTNGAGTAIVWGSVATSAIAPGTASQILVTNAGATAAVWQTLSQDGNITALGALTITQAQAGAVMFGANSGTMYLSVLVSGSTAQLNLGTGTLTFPTLTATATGAIVALSAGTTLQLSAGGVVVQTLTTTSTKHIVGTVIQVNGANGDSGTGGILLNNSYYVLTPGANSTALYASGGVLNITDYTGAVSQLSGTYLQFNGYGASVSNGSAGQSLSIFPGGGAGGANTSTVPGALNLSTATGTSATSGTAAGAHGGDYNVITGSGANGLGSAGGGRAGNYNFTLGNGGLPGTSANSPGTGGTAVYTAGSGGAQTGAGNNSSGGGFSFVTGAAGLGGSGSAGNPGTFSVNVGGAGITMLVNAIGTVITTGNNLLVNSSSSGVIGNGAGYIGIAQVSTAPTNSLSTGAIIYNDGSGVCFYPAGVTGSTLKAGKLGIYVYGGSDLVVNNGITHFSAGGSGLIAIAAATTNPSASQTTGGIIYSDAVTGNLCLYTVSVTVPGLVLGTLAGGKNIHGIADTATVPTGGGTAMGLLYSVSGAMNWQDESGNIASLSGSTLGFFGSSTNLIQAATAAAGLTVSTASGAAGASSSGSVGALIMGTGSGTVASSGTAAGAHGGDYTLATGSGASGLGGNSPGGRGGTWAVSGGSGGSGVGTGIGGAGSSIILTAGNGGNSVSTSNNSSGGNITLNAGIAGTGGSGTVGLLGVISIQSNGQNIVTFGGGGGIGGAGMTLNATSVAKVTPTLTLSASQYILPLIRITGALTAAMTIAMPNIAGVWWFDLSAVTGAYAIGWTCGSSGSSSTVTAPVAGNLAIVMVVTAGSNAIPVINS